MVTMDLDEKILQLPTSNDPLYGTVCHLQCETVAWNWMRFGDNWKSIYSYDELSSICLCMTSTPSVNILTELIWYPTTVRFLLKYSWIYLDCDPDLHQKFRIKWFVASETSHSWNTTSVAEWLSICLDCGRTVVQTLVQPSVYSR